MPATLKIHRYLVKYLDSNNWSVVTLASKTGASASEADQAASTRYYTDFFGAIWWIYQQLLGERGVVNSPGAMLTEMRLQANRIVDAIKHAKLHPEAIADLDKSKCRSVRAHRTIVASPAMATEAPATAIIPEEEDPDPFAFEDTDTDVPVTFSLDFINVGQS